jgi:hypothetical protein
MIRTTKKRGSGGPRATCLRARTKDARWFQIPMEELSPPSEIIKFLLPTKSTNSRGHIVLILLVDVGFTSWTLKLVDIYTDGCSLKY